MASGSPSSRRADLRDRLLVPQGGCRVGADGGRALGEEAVRLVGEEGIDRADRLAGDAQGFTAGGEDREPWAAGEEGLGEGGGRADDMFAVVKDQELAARGAVLDEQGDRVVLRGRQLGGHQDGLAQTEGADHRARHRLRPVERRQLGQPRLREPGGGFLGEAGLPGAARSGERDETGPVQFGTDGIELGFPAHEGGKSRTDVAGALGELQRCPGRGRCNRSGTVGGWGAVGRWGAMGR